MAIRRRRPRRTERVLLEPLDSKVLLSGVLFAPPILLPGIADATGAVIADFDGDGKNDLAVSRTSGAQIYLGQGDGTFGVPQPIAGTGGISTADINGDGIPDLVSAQNTGLVTLLGNGDGTFRTAGSTPLAGNFQTAFADLNSDGKADLVLASISPLDSDTSPLEVELGNGDGTFGAPTTYAVSRYALSPVVRDLNGDGLPDIAVVGAIGGGASVLLATGGGAFGTPTTIAAGANPQQLAVSDVNGDGVPDLVVANGDGATTTLLGAGDGTFAAGTSIASGGFTLGVTSGDLDGNGDADLVTVSSTPVNAASAVNTVSAYVGSGHDAFGAPKVLSASTDGSYTVPNLNPERIVTGDLDGDGYPDVVLLHPTNTMSSSGSLSVAVLLNRTGPDVAISGAVATKTKADKHGTVVGGSTVTGKVTLANAGVTFSKDPVEVDLFLSREDGSGETALSTVTLPAVSLKAGAKKTVPFSAVLPTNLDGNFEVLAFAKPAGSIVTKRTSANVAIGPTFDLAATYTNLTATSLKIPSPVPGKKETAVLTITNNSNVDFDGSTPASLFYIDQASLARTDLASTPAHLKLKPGGKATVRLTYILPSATGGTGGAITAAFDVAAGIDETTADDDSISQTVSIGDDR